MLNVRFFTSILLCIPDSMLRKLKLSSSKWFFLCFSYSFPYLILNISLKSLLQSQRTARAYWNVSMTTQSMINVIYNMYAALPHDMGFDDEKHYHNCRSSWTFGWIPYKCCIPWNEISIYSFLGQLRCWQKIETQNKIQRRPQHFKSSMFSSVGKISLPMHEKYIYILGTDTTKKAHTYNSCQSM